MRNPEIRVRMLDAEEIADLLSKEILTTALPAGDGLYSLDGKLFLIRGEKGFCCADTPEGRELLAALAGQEAPRPAKTAEDAIRILLRGCPKESTAQLMKQFRIRDTGGCCVIALTCENRNGADLCETIRTLAPTEKGDVLSAYSEDLCVLIKQGEDPAEAAEFTLALIDTAEGETGLRLRAGVGEPHRGPGEWAEGFREAVSALRTGKEFRLKGAVQVYRNQMLERLLGEIPAEKRRQYRRMIFNERTKKALSDEALETVEMFFASDLNLSDTARQMFIHRNTLTYRLDKIRKETGLDLRKFSDSVVFRVLTALPENAGEPEDGDAE